jgi:DNA-binding NarL/FixJ family response regulator
VGIFIADDDKEARSAIRLLLEFRAGLQVVGEATCADELQARLAETAPRLLLIDSKLRGLNGSRLLDSVRAAWPRLLVLELGTDAQTTATPKSGAHAYHSKLEPPERLVETVKRLLGDRSGTARAARLLLPPIPTPADSDSDIASACLA